MRVAIDATPLTCATGGIRRYVVELARALALQTPDDEVFLLSDQAGWELPQRLRDLPNVFAPSPEGQRLRTKWWSLGLPWALRKYRMDVFHGADFAVPYLPLRPSVLTVHDLSPWKNPPLQAEGSGRIRKRTPHLFRMATMLVTPSNAVKKELTQEFLIPPAKVAVTALAAGDDFCAVPDVDVTNWLRNRGLKQPYVVAMASSQPRKNLGRLLEAWREVCVLCPNLRLVCVGAGFETTMKEYCKLEVLPALEDRELQTLLSGAVAFVYPSLYEGFGLPVLEAMQVGAPVITSQDAAISEVAGDAALQVDVTNTKLLTEAIVEVSTNFGLRADLKAKGIQRSSQFRWRATALLTRQTYVEAIRRF